MTKKEKTTYTFIIKCNGLYYVTIETSRTRAIKKIRKRLGNLFRQKGLEVLAVKKNG